MPFGKIKSLQSRLAFILSVSSILLVTIIILINSFIMEYIYIISKTNTAIKLANKINKYYGSYMKEDNMNELIELENKKNIQIAIYDNNGDNVYYGSKEILRIVSNIQKDNELGKLEYTKNNIAVRLNDKLKDNTYKLLISKLDNGYMLYIKIPITPIREMIIISNQTLILIGLLMALISSISSSYLSKRFSKPIVELTSLTGKMANLDFSERYRNLDAGEEIVSLGDNINDMADKLQSTIEALQTNNMELEKDIKEKTKIEEMKNQFISDVSHELKTPIALIQGYSEGLIENISDDPESRKFYAEVINDEAKKMDKMVKELLELMRLEDQNRNFINQDFDIVKLVKDEVKRQTVLIKEAKIDLDFDEERKLLVCADPKYIEQIVNNYLTNAIKYCEEVKGNKNIIIRMDVKKNKVRVFVYNTGKKIPKESLSKIWDRFYKEDKSRGGAKGGSGIGLALVKAIMENYNNEYGVQNYEDGVEFYFDVNRSK